MAELTVKGFASKELKCDMVEYTFTFSKDGDSIAEAIANANNELERFLSLMEEHGVKAKSFKMGTVSSRAKYQASEEKHPYEAKRTIYLSLPLDATATNSILQLIADEVLDVEYSETHSASFVEETRKELLKLAMEDSKRKAEMIAACAGKKVLGIVKVSTNSDDYESSTLYYGEREVCYMTRRKPMKSDELEAATVEETEEVTVVWLIES